MRIRRKQSGLTVNAIAGTNVVHIGMDLDEAKRKGCLGFAVQREDHTEDEKYWMEGMKTFEATVPNPAPGGKVSSRSHPLQTFQWADYSAKPDHDYTYTTIPLFGTPKKLVTGDGLTLRVQTEHERSGRHSVFFNRGAISSQEYVRRFGDKAPNKIGPAAYEWLSRGLIEALIAFIERARDDSYEIYGAVYEFQWPDVLQALGAAKKRGVKVHIIYDAIVGDNNPREKNIAAIALAKIKSFCSPRTRGKIMHNKFFVLRRNEKPVAVWTGSTNLTENGIFGHSNCGHIVDDERIAGVYLKYWHFLHGDPERDACLTWMAADNMAPPDPWKYDTTAVFSPRKGIEVLNWYGRIAGAANEALFMTFAFGMHDIFKKVYEQNDGVLRFALMEKEGNGAGLAKGREDIRRIRKLPNVIVAVGNNASFNALDQWVKTRAQLGPRLNVKWIHTKYMLVDPLGDEPIVLSGSANFSKASTDTNDENMVVIRNDQRIADIYFGEFMRLHAHYAFREAVAIAKANGEEWSPKYLIPNDTWQRDHFSPGNPRFLKRKYFARV